MVRATLGRQGPRARTTLALGLLLHTARACLNDEDELQACYNGGTLEGVEFPRVCIGFGDCSDGALDSCAAKCDWGKLSAFCYNAQGCIDSAIGSRLGRTTGRQHCEQFRTIAGFMEGCACDANCGAADRGSGRPRALLLLTLATASLFARRRP